jgi:hypothetical protein
VDDQVRVMEELTSAESAEEDKETVIFWGVGTEGVDPPPPPPPPQEVIKTTDAASKNNFFMN